MTMFFVIRVLSISAAASSLNPEQISFKAKIDSTYDNLLKLDVEQIDQMMQISLRINEFDNLIDLFKNKKLYAEQSHVLMNKYLTNNNFDSAYYYFREVDQFYMQDHEKYSLLINRLNAQFIIWCFANHYTLLGTNILNSYIDFKNKQDEGISNPYWIYSVLLISYGSQNRLEQIIDVGEIILAMDIENDWSYIYKIGVCIEIANCYLILQKPNEALKYCELADNYSMNVSNDALNDPFISIAFNVSKIENKIFKAVCYSQLKDFQKAEINLQDQDKLLSTIVNSHRVGPLDAFDDIKISTNWAYMIYFFEKGDYMQANKYLMKNKESNFQEALYPDYKNTLKWDAIICEKMGKYQEANAALEKQISFRDSLYNVNLTKEMNSTWAMFEVEKAQKEKMKSDLKTDRLYIISISIAILAIVLITLIIYFLVTNKRLKAKNRILFLQQKESLNSNSLIVKASEDSILEVIDKMESTYPEESNSRDLFVRITTYLQETKDFTNVAISRESLAKSLGTNRQYIIDAITENANMTFNEFINNFRLDYARNQLTSKDKVLIKSVYVSSGFNSRNTFSQLFKDKFGMSPSEFRECAQEEFNIKK